MIDVVDILQRVVEEKLKLRNNLQLVADTLPQTAPQQPVLLLQRRHDRRTALKGENADVNFRIAEIRRDPNGRNRRHHPLQQPRCLFRKDIGHVALDLARN